MNKKPEENNYRIVDVNLDNLDDYCVCFEKWSEEMAEAGGHKACWYDKMKDRGLGVRLAEDSDGQLCGLIQYVPSEYAPLSGSGYYFIYCTWVHGHKKGIGNRQGRGIGSALLASAEEDIRSRDGSGIAAWGITMPFWMPAAWYKKHGYRVIQKSGMMRLVWKPLKDNAEVPQWLPRRKAGDISPEGPAVTVTSLRSGICPVMNLAYERAKKVSESFGGDVRLREIVTDEPEVLSEWGVSDALYINDTEIPLGAPISEKKIERTIRKQLQKAGKRR